MVRKRARLGRAVKASQRQLSALRGSFASFGFLLLTAPCNDVDPRGLALGPAAFDASLSLQAGLQNKHYPFLIGSGPTSLQDAVRPSSCIPAPGAKTASGATAYR